MMKKKTLLMLVLAVAMVFSLAACGGGGGGNDEVKGETFDVGNFTVLVPEGWEAVPVDDVWNDDPAVTNPDNVNIYKVTGDTLDQWNDPAVNVVTGSVGSNSLEGMKNFYDDVKDLDEQKIGNLTWNGFTGSSMGYNLAMLWAEDGDNYFQVTIWMNMSNGELKVEDADVQAILGSVAHK